MTAVALMVLLTASSVAAGFFLLRANDIAQQRASLIAVDLRFPRDVPLEGVQAFLGAVSGLLPPWWRRWRHLPFIVLEAQADHRGIRHRLLVPRLLRRAVISALGAHLPDVAYQLSPAQPTWPPLRTAAEYRLTNGDRSLAVTADVQAAQLLTSMQPLARNETITLQVLLAPARPVQPARIATSRERADRVTVDATLLANSEAVTALRKKHAHPLVLTTLRLGVQATTVGRARYLLRHVEATLHGTRAPGTLLVRRLLLASWIAGRLRSVAVPLHRWPALLNTVEAAGLVGFPIGSSELAGLSRLGSRLLPVPVAVPYLGTAVGTGTHPRTERPVAIDLEGRRHHLLLLGPTGSGKSVLATHTVVTDAAQRGSAAIVIDPKDGSLVDSICEALPERRLRDVIVLDPTDPRPVGFDPLASTPETRELVVDRVLGLMIDIWRANLGPRSADLLRHAFLTVAASPGLTMVETPRLLSDVGFRRRVVARLSEHDELRHWWAWADSLSTAEWASITAAPLNKLRAFVGRRQVAHTIGQSNPAVGFDRVLNEGQILLVRLPVGLLGEEATALLGALVTNQIWHAIAGRAAIPPSRRRPASVVIDEVATVLRFPSPVIDSMLTQARGYGVGITLAAQHLNQLPADLRHTTLANARSKVIFACGRDDAGVLAREFGRGLAPEDLMGLDAYHAIAALHAEGRTQSPASIRTLPPAEPLRQPEVVKAHSREAFGQDRDELAAEIRARVELPVETPGATVGRRRRTQE